MRFPGRGIADREVFRMEPRSRIVLRDATRRLVEMERSGEWEDPRDTEDGKDEGIG